MTMVVAIAVALLVLAVTNVWVHLGPSRVPVVTGPLAALLPVRRESDRADLAGNGPRAADAATRAPVWCGCLRCRREGGPDPSQTPGRHTRAGVVSSHPVIPDHEPRSGGGTTLQM